MQNFHLKKSLNFSLEFWAEIFKKDYQIDSAHPNRVRGYALAREALLELLQCHDIHLKPQELQLHNFNSLKHIEGYVLSLSHDPHMGAAFLALKNEYCAVGIDIELNARVVKDSIYERIKHPTDEIENPLLLWTLKEACFKSLMNTEKFSKNVEFNTIRIFANHTWNHPSGLAGHWQSSTEEDHLVSRAWIKA